MNFDMNNVFLAIIAIANACTAYFMYHNRSTLKNMATDMATVEKATNSMKDQLVHATAVASEARGYALGQAAGIKSADATTEKIAAAVRVEKDKP